MKQATLIFLIKKNQQNISQVCLGMKKRGFGVNKYNGFGGKVNLDESIEQAAIREAKEEANITAQYLKKVAIIKFTFPHKPEWNQTVHSYLCSTWQREVVESEEMRPQWFDIDKIPYDQMWDDDQHWMPLILNGKLIKADFSLSKDNIVISQSINIVKTLNSNS